MADGGTSNLTAEQNAISYGVAQAISQASPVTDVNRCNGTVNFQMGTTAARPIDATHVTATAFTPYMEPIVLFIGTTAATANSISYQINLSAFKDTILELNKNIYWGNNLVLNINWNAAIKMGFSTTAIAAVDTLTALLAFTIPPQLNNLFLYTACETDPTIISALVSVVNAGNFNLMVPFVNYQNM